MREVRLLVLANKAAGHAPGQRYRFEQWAPHLAAEHGIRTELVAFESDRLTQILYEPRHVAAKAAWVTYDFARRIQSVRSAAQYDAILIFREAALIGPAIYERLLARTGKPIIYDFDDAIWSPGQAWKNGWFSRLRFTGKTSTICQLASAVTTGNAFLADYARQRNANVHIIPSSIELADYPLIAEPANEGKFIVGWTGSTSTLVHFEHARPALEALAQSIPLVVKVICSRPPDRPIAGAETRFVPWSAEREAQDVGECHVGIMPLPDNEVSRGKGGMKALQFMATGRPVVVSPVGVNREIVKHGTNGYLATSTDDYVAALTDLAQSKNKRRAMGLNARETIEREYSAEISASKFAAVVLSLTG